MSLSFAILLLTSEVVTPPDRPVPTGYALIEGEDLRLLITGATIVPKAPKGQSPPGELYTRDGEYRFFGPEAWSPRGPYIIDIDKVCLKLEKEVCFKYYKDSSGSFVRREDANPYSDFEFVNISK